MQSLLELYRQALGRVGGDELSGADDLTTVPGRRCVELFPHVLHLALSSFDWSFAMARETLTKASGKQDPATERYRFRYTLPANCIRPHSLDGGRDNQTEPFVIEGQTLLTDKADAVLVYVSNVDSPTRWPGYFAEALVWGLAAELASAKLNDVTRQRWFSESYANALRNAMMLDVAGQIPRVDGPRSAWNAARHGGMR